MEAEEEAAGSDVADTAVTTMDLTGTTKPMDGFMKWTSPNSGGVSEFESTEDSRCAQKFLVEKCEGKDATNKRVLLATRVVYLSPNDGEILYINEYQF